LDPENPALPPGPARPPEPWESGPGIRHRVSREITRLVAKFDLEGQYVWHRHILDHEDHDMMRRMAIGRRQTPE
jgi:FtsP/CotA-like multicopper oxidase with cupredoxin domain